MSFLNYIRQSFTHVLARDTEFRFDSTKTIPNETVCDVYIDVFTGESWSYWENNKTHTPPHWDYADVLIISYNATAEIGYDLKLLHGRPNNIWDAYVENNRLYKHIRSGKGENTLLATADFYGIKDRISEADKLDNVKLIINNKTYTKDQREQILEYCKSDAELLRQIFIKQVHDIEDKNKLKADEDYERELWQILNRGYSVGCGAVTERTGTPVDLPLLKYFNDNWSFVKNKLIRKFNKELGVFADDLSFKFKKFDELIIRNNLADRWKRLKKSGHFSTDKNIIKKFSHIPDIKKIAEIKKFIDMTKLSFFNVGADGRARAPVHLFGTITGRTTTSSKLSPFGGPRWVRNFIKPSWGNYLVYMDYVSQEPAVMGYLSQDPELIKIYQSGEDVYIAMAKMFKMVPADATKKSHPRERGICKVSFLASVYGGGPGRIANDLNCSLGHAKALLMEFKHRFRVYIKWIESIIEGGLINKKLETVYGWQRYIKQLWKYKNGKRVDIRNSLLNWPIQSHGAEILRRAHMDLIDNHFEVCALVHDALLIQITIPEFSERVEEAKQIMVNASVNAVNGPIRVEAEKITGNFKQADKDQETFNEIMKEIKNYRGTLQMSGEVHPKREHPPILLNI